MLEQLDCNNSIILIDFEGCLVNFRTSSSCRNYILHF